MKIFTNLFICTLLILFSKMVFSQVTIVDAVAVDGNSDGYYGTIEIEFSMNIADSEVQTSAITDKEWIFSLSPTFSDTLYPTNFNSGVSYIASASPGNNDQYIQFVFSGQFSSSHGPVYFQYKNSNADAITAQSSNDTLYDFAIFEARDFAPPVISSVTSNATDAGVLKVGESITFTVDYEDTIPDPYITVLPLQYNGRDLNWSTNNAGDTYKGTYTVTEGDPDQTSFLQLTGVTAEDKYGNVSDPFDGTDVAKTIDANTPCIDSLISDANIPDTLIVGDSINFTLYLENPDPNLNISPSTYNGENLNWTEDPAGVGNTYKGTYIVAELNEDRKTPLQLTGVTATDPAGNISNTFNGTDVAVSIDANPPKILSVNSDATAAGVLKVGDRITFTIDAETPDGTLSVSPTNYNNRSLGWYTSNGGNTYTGVYNVTEGDDDQTTALQLENVQLTDPAGNVSNLFNGTDVAKTIDANTPRIDSLISDANNPDTLIVGDSINFTLYLENPDTSLNISPSTYNGENLNWSEDPVGVGNTYKGTYIVAELNEDRKTPLQLTGVTATDPAGNISNTFNGTDVAVSIDANPPKILSVTSDATAAGVLKVGDKITFTIDVETPDGTLSVSPVNYNNRSLGWYTSNGGDTYTGIYNVIEGDDDQAIALQLENVQLTDPAGNVSNSFNGTDVAKTIDANSPDIIGFEISDTPKLFGEIVQTTIKVSSDTVAFTLISGSVANFSIDSIEKNTDSTYYAYFTVTSLGYDIEPEQDYMVSNLVLSDDAGNISATFQKTISHDNDPIYTILPTAKVKGKYHICDQDSAELSFQLTGNAPWDVELFDGTSATVIKDINESPYFYKVEAIDQNPSIEPDTVIYKVTQVKDVNGNIKVMAGTDSAMVFAYEVPTVTITAPPGNQTYNIEADADTLAGSPTGGIFSGNGIVSSNSTFLPSAAGLGNHEIVYRYTIPSSGCYSSDTVYFDVIESNADIILENNDAWRCDYESTFGVTAEVITDTSIIGELKLYAQPDAITDHGDNTATIDVQKLTAGTYEITFEYTDGSFISVTKSFTVESVGNNVNFSNIADQCEDYDTIFVDAFNLIPSGGNGKFSFSGSGSAFEYDPADPDNNSGYFLPGQIVPGNYDLEYVYTTPNGCESDTIIKSFNVNALPSVSFIMNSVYNIEQGSSTIIGSPQDNNGLFTPLSFMSNNGDGTADFDPADAGLGFHWIKYTYQDVNGCVNADSMEIEVNEALGEIESSSGTFQYCYYGSETDTLTGAPNPTDGSPGSFYIDDIPITPVDDNKILLNPQDYTSGDHTVKFEFFNGTTSYFVYKTINIDSVGNIYFTGLDNNYCQDKDTEIELTAFYPGLSGNISFTGNGIEDDLDDELAYFNPSEANLGDNLVTYTFTRDYSGCQKVYNKYVTINKTPYVAFYPDEQCIVDSDDPLGFNADTLMSDSIVGWEWKFRNAFTSGEPKPQFFPVPGYNAMSLTLTTNKGCSKKVDSLFYIGTRVDLEFTYENECHGETVLFELITSTDNTDVDSVKWNFGGDGISDLSDLDNPTHQYAYPGGYDVIYEEFTKSCGRIGDTVKLNIRPSIDLSYENYLEQFEDEPDITGWVVEDFIEGVNNSWQWGVPDGEKINSAASGNNAFVTNLSGNYLNNEKSMITSPCFDFSNMRRPMMKMDFISFSEDDRDGAVIQYTQPNGDWTTIGVPNDGINWYNSYIITGAPANQQLGWTGNLTNIENNGWRTAMYRLDELRGRGGVRFRIVFGSNGDFTDEGLGFDNIEFKERRRLVLLENFTNTTDETAKNVQANIIDPILRKDSLDVISINYHTSFPGSNPFNSFYPSGPSARALFYGVSAVPYTVLDGGERQFDYLLGHKLAATDLHKRMLVDPEFEISIKQDIQGNKFVVSSTLRASESITNTNIIAQVAIIEKTVVDGAETFNNVLRTMLPDAAGTFIEKDWNIGDSAKVYQTWDIPEGVNQDSLIAVVFIQDEETKEVYQTAYTEELSTITAIGDLFLPGNEMDYLIYPNPASEQFMIKLTQTLNYDLNVQVYNNTGILVNSGVIQKGSDYLEMNVKNLPVGVYYIKITDNNSIVMTKKIIINN